MTDFREALVQLDQATPTAQTLSGGRRLFSEAGEIGSTYEHGMQGLTDDFYRRAVELGYRVLAARPWEEAPFAAFRREDDFHSLAAFLRGGFAAGRGYKTAQQQANVVAMLVIDGLTAEDVRGIGFRRLLKLSYAVNFIGKDGRLTLLRGARSATTNEFEAQVESAKRGVHIEPRQIKVLPGSQSAADVLDHFEAETGRLGDARPVLDRVADTLNQAMADPDFNEQYAAASNEQTHLEELLAAAVIRGFCRHARRMSPELESHSDNRIIADIVYGAWEITRDNFDEETEQYFL